MNKMLEDLKAHESEKQHILKSWFIDPLDGLYEELTKFKELVESTLDLELADKGEFIVNPSFDETFQGRSFLISFFNKVYD